MPEEIVEEQSIESVFANAKPEDFRRVEATTQPATQEAETEEVVEAITETAEVVTEVKEETVAEDRKEVAEKIYDWKAEIKKLPSDEVLKELGLDEFEIGLLKYRKETGDLAPYLEAKTVDYANLPDEQIMRRDLRKQYKELSDEDFELLYQDEVNDRFKLDPDVYDEAQIKIGLIRRKAEADKIRVRMIDEQSKFKIPEKQKEQSNEPDYAKLKEEWEQTVTTNDATKKLLEDKRLVLGGKDSQFNFDVDDPQSVIDGALDNTKFWADFTKDNVTDFAKFYKVSAYAKNMEKIEQALINHGKSLGKKAVDKELKNPSKPDAGKSHDETTGDFNTDIGNAFLRNGVRKKY